MSLGRKHTDLLVHISLLREPSRWPKYLVYSLRQIIMIKQIITTIASKLGPRSFVHIFYLISSSLRQKNVTIYLSFYIK